MIFSQTKYFKSIKSDISFCDFSLAFMMRKSSQPIFWIKVYLYLFHPFLFNPATIWGLFHAVLQLEAHNYFCWGENDNQFVSESD